MSYNYIVNSNIEKSMMLLKKVVIIIKEAIVRGSEDNGTHVSVVSPLESWQSHDHRCQCI